MALSDACFEFMQATADAAEALAAAVHHYAAPDYPISYGIEIDALRRACAAVKESPFDPKSGAELLRLAASVMTFHDTPPDTPESLAREVEMKKLIRLLQATLEYDDRTTVPAIIETSLPKRDSPRKQCSVSKLCCRSLENLPTILQSRSSATSARRPQRKCWASESDAQPLQHHHQPSRDHRALSGDEPIRR